MTRNKKLALFFAATFAICPAAVSARPQGAATAVAAAASVILPKPAEAHGKKLKNRHFEVLHMMPTGIQVRSLENQREVHTFTYSERIREEMQTLMNTGAYQYGDRVKIQYEPGTEVALRIKGKPSPAKLP